MNSPQPSIRRPKIRGLVLRSFIASTLVSFALFIFLFVMFGFDLEDQIFEHQMNLAADKLVQSGELLSRPSGPTTALDMEYYVGTADMPDWMKAEIDPQWSERTYEIFAAERGHFHVIPRLLEDGRTLYLLFNARPYIRSTPQIQGFLVIIAVMAGAVFLVSLFFMTRMTRKVSVPLETLAANLGEGERLSTEYELPAFAPDELHALALALDERNKRIEALLERERQFNRDASHELRTPLAVALGASEVMEASGEQGAAFTRLKTALQDTQLLTDGILWLGRDPSKTETCDVTHVCRQSVEAYRHLTGDRDVEVAIEGEKYVLMPVPEPVARVIVGNVLKNALSYTDHGSVRVHTKPGGVDIIDTGVGYGQVDTDKQGFGVGLSLVTRLCQHFDIAFSIDGNGENGTKASLNWSTDH